jgi:hypothetical protein
MAYLAHMRLLKSGIAVVEDISVANLVVERCFLRRVVNEWVEV